MNSNITNQKLQNLIDGDYSFSDIVLTHNQANCLSRKNMTTETGLLPYDKHSHNCPIILSNMPCVQTSDDILKIFDDNNWFHIRHRICPYSDIHEYVVRANKENWDDISISIGVQKKDKELLSFLAMSDLFVNAITIDVAHIYNKAFEEPIKWVREQFPNSFLIAGNFTTVDAAKWLYDLGVDAAKMNIGASALCRTRQYTGFGTATISDLYRVSVFTKSVGMKLISDGGLTILNESNGDIAYGDIFKALNFGADFVMSSALFRWCSDYADENGYIHQYGNSTARAKGHENNVEGAEKVFKTNGRSIEETMKVIKGHIQSSMSYAGIKNLADAYLSCDWRVVR